MQGLDLVLIDQRTGNAWPANRELAYYAGLEDGERWSEGSPSDFVVFSGIPPGSYYLMLDPELSPEGREAVQDRLEVQVGGVGWSNFVLFALFIGCFPLFAGTRSGSFEASRWAESDHPPGEG